MEKKKIILIWEIRLIINFMHKNTAYSCHLQLNLNFLLDFISIYIKHFQTFGLSDVIINTVIVHKCAKLVITKIDFLSSIYVNILLD